MLISSGNGIDRGDTTLYTGSFSGKFQLYYGFNNTHIEAMNLYQDGYMVSECWESYLQMIYFAVLLTVVMSNKLIIGC